MCFTDNEGITRLENIFFAFRQIVNSHTITFLLLLYVSSVAVYNYTGIMVTKYISSSSRAIMDNLRVIIIWVFFLLPVWPSHWIEEFSFLQFIGFSTIVYGAFIYYEIIYLECWSLQIEKRSNNIAELKEILN
jgi:hypothetical protein